MYLFKKSLNKFGLGMRTEFPTVTDMAQNILLSFCIEHLFRETFSILMKYKSNISKFHKKY